MIIDVIKKGEGKNLEEIGNIEKYGTGFIRIKKELADYPNVSFEFRAIGGGMQSIFYKNVTDNATKETPKETPKETISKLENKILTEIKNDVYVTAIELSKKLNISVHTVREYIGKLKKKEMLRHIGPTKGGHWEVMERGNEK